jgi:hypothetical protein
MQVSRQGAEGFYLWLLTFSCDQEASNISQERPWASAELVEE